MESRPLQGKSSVAPSESAEWRGNDRSDRATWADEDSCRLGQSAGKVVEPGTSRFGGCSPPAGRGRDPVRRLAGSAALQSRYRARGRPRERDAVETRAG